MAKLINLIIVVVVISMLSGCVDKDEKRTIAEYNRVNDAVNLIVEKVRNGELNVNYTFPITSKLYNDLDSLCDLISNCEPSIGIME